MQLPVVLQGQKRLIKHQWHVQALLQTENILTSPFLRFHLLPQMPEGSPHLQNLQTQSVSSTDTINQDNRAGGRGRGLAGDIRQLLPLQHPPADPAPPEAHLGLLERRWRRAGAMWELAVTAGFVMLSPGLLDGSGVAVGSHGAATAEALLVFPASRRRAVGSQLRLSWCEINVKLEPMEFRYGFVGRILSLFYTVFLVWGGIEFIFP